MPPVAHTAAGIALAPGRARLSPPPPEVDGDNHGRRSPVGPCRAVAPAAGLPVAAAGEGPRRRWHSHELLGDAAEVEIEHDAQLYRLRRTALGKLILTK